MEAWGFICWTLKRVAYGSCQDLRSPLEQWLKEAFEDHERTISELKQTWELGENEPEGAVEDESPQALMVGISLLSRCVSSLRYSRE